MEFETFEENIVCGGEEVKWPEKCRNCQSIYSGDLKIKVTRLVKSGDVTLLKAVSKTLLENGITKYCCLNNFKPRTDIPNISKVSKDIFIEIRPGVFIDKTMGDWVDIVWECDDYYDENVNSIKSNQCEDISLFEL